MTRFQKLAAATVVTTLVLVTIGVIVRATGSGMGCPDWPLCHGQLIPPLDDYKAWIEWIHRDGRGRHRVRGPRPRAPRLVATTATGATLLWPSLGAVAARRVPGVARAGDRPAQQLRRVGHGPPRRGDGARRAARLHPRPLVLPGPDRRPRRQPAVHAARGVRARLAVFALLLFGSHVTATVAVDRLPGLAADERRRSFPAARPRPDVGPRPPPLGRGRRRADRRGRRRRRLADAARPAGDRPARGRRRASCSRSRPSIGGLQVLTRLSGWTQTLHLALGALIWALVAGARRRRLLRGADPDRRVGRRGSASRPRRRGATATARRRDRAATPSAPTSP